MLFMAINPNTQLPQPERRRSRLTRYAGNIATAIVMTAGIAAGVEVTREFATYELKDKPALKDTVAGVKEHQKNLRAIVEDGQYRLRGVEGTPYNKPNVVQLRALAKQKNGVDKAIPPVITHNDFEGPGSFTATNFASEQSRQTVVDAVERTIKETGKTKLDKEGLDHIFAQYEANLAEERGEAVQQEEAAIATGLQATAEKYNEVFDDKPILTSAGYEDGLRVDTGLMLTDIGLKTADYPKGAGPFTPPIDILPDTLGQALNEVYDSPTPQDLLIKLPK